MTDAGGIVLTEEFDDALTHLNSGSSLLLTGKAGTGKSTLIRHFMERTARKVVVVAPTGIAALNVGGYTIHRLFSFHAGLTVQDMKNGRYFPGRFSQTLKSLDTLIIDEASMVRADLFDKIATALVQFGPEPGRPFGGVQIVLVGDLYQLPPVVAEGEKPYFRSVYESEYFFSAQSYRPEAFHTVQLSHIFRQQGDPRLVEILNDVREGILLDDARTELNRLAQPDFEPPADEFWLTLTTTNRAATHRNHAHLDRLDGQEHVSIAEVTGDLTDFEPPTDAHLLFKSGAQVMLLNNDDAGRWVNGTIGRIVGVCRDGWDLGARVRLPDGSVEDVWPHTWDVTRPNIAGGSLQHEVIGTYRQLPFRLAWAITIHKSQGQTLERVVVDLTGGTFADGQLYVALSRCTSMDGLVLRRPVGPKDLKVDQRVRRFLLEAAPRVPQRHVYLALRTVGDEGRMWKPRPVEIALLDEDGALVTTLINPDRDMGDARSRLGLSSRDVQLAPLLAHAWAALEPHLAGRVPVGVDIDRMLGYVDYELKRNGRVTRVPLGVSVSLPRSSALWNEPQRTVEEEVFAVRDAFLAGAAADRPAGMQGQAFPEALPAAHRSPGYLLSRRAEKGIGADSFVLPSDPQARLTSAELLGDACRRSRLDEEQITAIRGLEERLGLDILPVQGGQSAMAADILLPETRVCFSGTAYDGGRLIDKPELELMALMRGLKPVATVTKTRTDVLVTAEAGSQSSKAKNALKFGKPVITAEEFLAWAAERPDGYCAERTRRSEPS